MSATAPSEPSSPTRWNSPRRCSRPGRRGPPAQRPQLRAVESLRGLGEQAGWLAVGSRSPVVEPETEARPARLAARRETNRSRILEAAAGLRYFAGVAATTLDDVLAASDTRKSPFCRHFPDNEALVHTIVEVRAEEVLIEQEEQLGLSSLAVVQVIAISRPGTAARAMGRHDRGSRFAPRSRLRPVPSASVPKPISRSSRNTGEEPEGAPVPRGSPATALR